MSINSNNDRIELKAKRTEPGAIPSSVPCKGLVNSDNQTNFWGSHQNDRLLS